MNLTIGNLAKLKAWLLPETWQSETQKDGIIAALGLGVAGAMETFCNRKLGYAVAETQEYPANEAVFITPRYPLIAKPTLEVRWEGTDAFEDATGFQWSYRLDIGKIDTVGPVGTLRSVLRVTYTGGFWIDDTEDNSGTLPTGATAMPQALVSAWQMQCRHLWTAQKLFGNTGENPAEQQHGHILLPIVQQMIAPYRRFTL